MSEPSAEKDAASEEARHRFLTEPVVRPVDNRDNCSPCLYALLSRCERGQCIRGTDKDWTRVTPPAASAACGVTFQHDSHGYLDDDGRTRVCDGGSDA